MKFEDLTMNNLKTKDLPIMMRIVKKLDLKNFLADMIDVYYNEDVPESILKELEGKKEDEQKEIVKDYKQKKNTEIFISLLDEVVTGYDKVHTDLESLIANVYSLKVKEVSILDLDVTLQCIYNLKEQEQLINFFKTALK